MLIGLSGPAGAGKTTMATHLAEKHGFVRISLADPIRDMMRALVPDLRDLPKERDTPLLNGHSPRMAMQTLGTEWGRDIMGEDFWCQIWRERYANLGPHRCVVDDVRYENEAAMLRGLGGKVIGISGRTTRVNPHRSEAGVAVDMTYHNNADLPEMRGWASYVIGMIR